MYYAMNKVANDAVASDVISGHSKKGYALLKRGNIDEAKEEFEQVLRVEPDNTYALVGMGDADRRLRDYSSAANYYVHCLRNVPDNNFALFGLADCYKSMNQIDKAIAIWEEYIKYDSQNVGVLTRLADSYRKMKNYKQSKELYDRVLEIESSNSYAIMGLANLSYDMADYKAAISYWLTFYNNKGGNVDIRALTSMGNCYKKLHDFNSAIRLYKDALAIDKDNFYALSGLADSYRYSHQEYLSIEYWERIIGINKIEDYNVLAFVRLGNAYRGLGKYKEASKYYTQALKYGNNTWAFIGLAAISKGTGDYSKAIDTLRRAITLDQSNYRLYTELADCYMKIDQRDNAIQVLELYQSIDVRIPILNDMLEKIRQGVDYNL